MAAEKGPASREQVSAITSWVEALVKKRKVHDASDLCDGAALLEVLSNVDDSHFSIPWRCSMDALCKQMQLYYSSVLGMDEDQFPVIDVKSASKKKPLNYDELLKVLRLVVDIVLKTDDNDQHVSAMQNLPVDQQVVMKAVVENIMSDTTSTEAPTTDETEVSGVVNHTSGNTEYLEKELAEEKRRSAERQDQLAQFETDIERLTKERDELAASNASLREVEKERDTMRDQLDEWRQIVDQSKKQEKTLEKLRERAAEAAELKRQVKEIEKSQAHSNSKSTEKKDRYVSELTDKLKAERQKLEQKIDEWEKKHSQLEKEHSTLQTDFKVLQEEKQADKDQLTSLLERVHTLEQDGLPRPDLDALSSTDAMTELQAKVTQLELENKSLMDRLDSTTSSVSGSHDKSEASFADVQAEIVAMRNNSKSKETEALNLLNKLEKKWSKDGNKSVGKDMKAVRDLLSESFQMDDVVIQRLQACSDQTVEQQHKESAMTNADLLRELDALRQEQRLMASAFQKMSSQLYSQTSWSDIAHIRPNTEGAPPPPSLPETLRPSNTSWLAQQRDALAGALRLSRK